MIVLGVTHPISWNPAAALLVDGRLAAMAEEERFNRFKYSPRLPPVQAMRWCLSEAGLRAKDVDLFAVGWEDGSAQKRRKRIAWDALASRLPFDRKAPNVRFVRHHWAHAASAFYPSGFGRANVISLDAYGGSESGLLARGEGADLEVLHRVPTKQSWGAMYGMVTQRLGFAFHRDEGKLMGLAAWGAPRPETADFVDWDREVPEIRPDRFRAFLERSPRRAPGDPIGREHQDLAATAQAVLERAVLRMAEFLHRRTGLKDFCLAGGTALNCAANGALLAQPFVGRLFVNPAAHDAGSALGAALWAHREAEGVRPGAVLANAFHGPSFDSGQVEAALRDAGLRTWARTADPAAEAAERILKGQVVGWFQGRMEVGPRALGARSILADPRERATADRVNDLKGRERWRPLAPSVPAADAGEYVERPTPSPFMLLALKAKPEARGRIAAATHVDGSVRLQTVRAEDHARFARLLAILKDRRGFGAVLNTSFNLAGEPLVCRPRDALGTFFASGLDALVIEDCVVWK
ncbi:MAG: carbamoyltransferase [Planctomycetes bacterium]|nr:carbamoyltransferase [Planctomycetota bacterium]